MNDKKKTEEGVGVLMEWGGQGDHQHLRWQLAEVFLSTRGGKLVGQRM